MKEKQKKETGSRATGICLAAVIVAVLVFGLGIWLRKSSSPGKFAMLTELASLQADRTISAEELAFFTGVVRGMDPDADETEIRAYVAGINAEFFLGSQLKLCEPFEYATFAYRVEAENQDRAMKKLNGQVYYGPDSFTEESYFAYRHSALRSDLLTWLVDHRDADMVRAANDFYEAHKAQFTGVSSVTYAITEDGVTETKTLENDGFRTMGQSDPSLMNFLQDAEIGEERLLPDGTGRTVKKLDITTELPAFAEQERYVVEIWLLEDVLDPLIGAIAANTNLVF